MKRNGLTLIELLFSIAIIVVLVALLLPAIHVTHGPAKRVVCQSNLRQIVLGMTNYQSAHLHFPSLRGVKGFDGVGSSDQLGPLVEILPYLDENERFEKIAKGCVIRNKQYPPFPTLSTPGYDPWTQQSSIFQCPNVSASTSKFAKTHYGFCIGDRARNLAAPKSLRGCFAGSLVLSFDQIDDGSSNTIMAGEIGARNKASRENLWAVSQPASILESPVECFELVDGTGDNWRFVSGVPLSSVGRGSHWADGRAAIGVFNTILPPKSLSASVGTAVDADGIYSASGPHEGGINMARADGSVFFVASDIDAGDSSNATPTEEEMSAGVPSPYGVWGAFGTIDGGEVVTNF
jgi:prepilin-type N-terminal cleavage/methylation domain-containing protein/prepilin-type processing-associated H-X9-DG protein